MECAQPLVAVVGDEVLDVELMTTILADEGYATVSCTNSAHAYDFIRQQQPQLIIYDLAWRGPISGLFVIDLLQLDPTTQHIPMIVCVATTATARTTKQWLQRQGCSVVEKPFSVPAWLERVRAAVGVPLRAKAVG